MKLLIEDKNYFVINIMIILNLADVELRKFDVLRKEGNFEIFIYFSYIKKDSQHNMLAYRQDIFNIFKRQI